MEKCVTVKTDYNTLGHYNMPRLVQWFMVFSSGLMILVLFGVIVCSLLGGYGTESRAGHTFNITTVPKHSEGTFSTSQPEPKMPELKSEPWTPETPTANENADVGRLLQELHSRRGYSNPSLPYLEEEDTPEEVTTRRPRRKRPLVRIGPNFDPSKSYIIKQPNGTLTYVFPSSADATTTPSSLATSSRAYFKPVVMNDTIHRSDMDLAVIDRTTDRSASTEVFSNYPSDLINKVMRQYHTSFEGAFGEDVLVPEGEELHVRYDDSFEFLCESKSRLFHPTQGTTAANRTVMIVNTEEFRQGVRVEKCRDEGEPCKYCNFNSVCKQMYHYRILVAIDEETKQPYKEQILLPSCCKCGRK